MLGNEWGKVGALDCQQLSIAHLHKGAKRGKGAGAGAGVKDNRSGYCGDQGEHFFKKTYVTYAEDVT